MERLTLLVNSTRFLISSSTSAINFKSFLKRQQEEKVTKAAPKMAVNNRHNTTRSYKYGPGVFLQAAAVHRSRAATVEGLRGRVDLQCFRQTPVSLQSGALLVTFKPEKTNDVTLAANWHIRTKLKHKIGPTWPDSPPS